MTEAILDMMKKGQQTMPRNVTEYRTLNREIKNKCRQVKEEERITDNRKKKKKILQRWSEYINSLFQRVRKKLYDAKYKKTHRHIN